MAQGEGENRAEDELSTLSQEPISKFIDFSAIKQSINKKLWWIMEKNSQFNFHLKNITSYSPSRAGLWLFDFNLLGKSSSFSFLDESTEESDFDS